MHAADPKRYRGLRVTIMGLGRFGGGVAAARFLADRGARITVTDLAPEEKLAESLAELDGTPIAAFTLGRHDDEDFRNADLVIVNPAVPRDNRYLEIAGTAGVPLTSEMNLFWEHQRGRTVGVTGSNGKSTTTALIHSILKAAGRRCHLGGNIGRSLLPIVDEIGPDDWCVVELSSFQLADLDRIQASPDVAVVTNFAPNHLDWHGTLDDYRCCKQAILRWQRPDGIAVLNCDDPDVAAWPTGSRRLVFGMQDTGNDGAFANGEGECVVRLDGREERVPLGQWLKLPGRHNLQNALAAVCATAAMEVELGAMRRGIEGYEPLPHRLQFVGEANGVRFYNDSLATTPESAIAALEAFTEPIVLLAGGYDKKVDLTALAAAIALRASAVALMGQTAGLLEQLIERQREQPGCLRAAGLLSHRASSLADAFAWAVAQARPGSVVLLSPGCASYDGFRNFADRGDQFTNLVRTIEKADCR